MLKSPDKRAALPLDSAARETVVATHPDHHFLEITDIAVDVSPPFPHLNDRIAHHLARTVIRDVPAPPGLKNLHPPGSQQVFRDENDNLLNPTVIIEVLSKESEAYDRGEKFAQYRRVPSLQEFMLVDLDTRRTDVYRKGTDGMWVLHPFDAGQTVHLASVNLDISAQALFAEVEPGPASASAIPRG